MPFPTSVFALSHLLPSHTLYHEHGNCAHLLSVSYNQNVSSMRARFLVCFVFTNELIIVPRIVKALNRYLLNERMRRIYCSSIHNKSEITTFGQGLFSIPINQVRVQRRCSKFLITVLIVHSHTLSSQALVFVTAGPGVSFLLKMEPGLRGTIISKPRIEFHFPSCC